MTNILAAMTTFVLTSVYTTQDIPHFCRVPEVWDDNITNFSSWTLEEKRTFSIPSKPASEAPAIGQTYRPCTYYDLPYKDYAGMRFNEAMQKRDETSALKTDTSYVKNCGSTVDKWVYDFRTKDFKDSVQVDVNSLEEWVVKPVMRFCIISVICVLSHAVESSMRTRSTHTRQPNHLLCWLRCWSGRRRRRQRPTRPSPDSNDLSSSHHRFRAAYSTAAQLH